MKDVTKAAAAGSGATPALVAAYREGLALTAVLVIAGPDVVRMGIADHSGEATLAAEETIAARWWCRRTSHPEYIFKAVKRRRRATDDASDRLAHLCESIARIAGASAMTLQSDEEVAAEARAVVARLDDEMVKQKQAGVLKPVNKAYRDYRLERTARGERVVPYAQWMNRYKVKLIRDIAANLRGF
jgi:hypothetical protein